MTERIGDIQQLLSPEDVLGIAEPVLRDFEVTAHPLTDPRVFQEQLSRANPRFSGQGKPFIARQMLEQDAKAYPDRTGERIMAAAADLRMLDKETPLTGSFGSVLVLGAARRAVTDRALYGAEAITRGRAEVGRIAIITTARPLQSGEDVAAGLRSDDIHDKNRLTEGDLGRAAQRALTEQYSQLQTPVQQIEIANPRADTYQTVKDALDALNTPTGTTVAAITTQIYRTRQGLEAQRAAAEYDTLLQTAGNPSDPAIVAKRTMQTYLAEVLSTARSAQNSLRSRS